jgi:hypothetical protein
MLGAPAFVDIANYPATPLAERFQRAGKFHVSKDKSMSFAGASGGKMAAVMD